MKAVLLIGGKGTRIRTLYADRPKALIPVGKQTILEWQLEWLRRNGITGVHLAAGFMGEKVAEWVGEKDKGDTPTSAGKPGKDERHPTANGQHSASNAQADPRSAIDHRPSTMPLTVSVEPRPLGTAGGIKFVEPWIDDDRFMVLNGDSLAPMLDFQALEERHALFSNHWKNNEALFQPLETLKGLFPTIGKNMTFTSPPLMTLAVTRVESAGRYGTVEFDESGRITAFLEKADREQGWINAGVYLMNRSVLALIPSDGPVSIEEEIFPKMAKAGLLEAFPFPPPLLDMGTPEGLAAMEAFFED